MTERFQIIHLGNPYDFVIKDHETNKTYGTFQGDSNALKEFGKDIAKEKEQLKNMIKEAYANERTQIGKNVLRQLLESLK